MSSNLNSKQSEQQHKFYGNYIFMLELLVYNTCTALTKHSCLCTCIEYVVALGLLFIMIISGCCCYLVIYLIQLLIVNWGYSKQNSLFSAKGCAPATILICMASMQSPWVCTDCSHVPSPSRPQTNPGAGAFGGAASSQTRGALSFRHFTLSADGTC